MKNSYYANINVDLLKAIPSASSFVLEVGAGTGQLGKAYRSFNPGTCYVGIEIFEDAAREATENLDHIINGDAANSDTLLALDRYCAGRLFDALVLGDVIEHFVNPWHVLRELRARMAPGAMCVACIPNIAHWSVIHQLLHGRWNYTDMGLLDRTHLRFFTFETAVELFTETGWSFLDASPRILMKEPTDSIMKELLPLSAKLGISPAKMSRDLSAFQWVIRSLNPPDTITAGK
ncbi:MAG: class I SAM-dependent methyltransferase [Chlorobiaceae bacterium]|nr:class I SAM-dependent methyltransferase [Chlorobiaceae bacterium]